MKLILATATILLLALLLSAIWLLHALATGIAVPYPDPTPEQAVYERRHFEISMYFFVLAAIAWLLGIVLSVGVVGRWRMGRGNEKTTRLQEPPLPQFMIPGGLVGACWSFAKPPLQIVQFGSSFVLAELLLSKRCAKEIRRSSSWR